MIEFADVIKIVIALLIGQIVVGTIGGLAFVTKATEWHKANQHRFQRLEKGMGLDDPEERAFLLRSEADRMNDEKNKEHDHLWSELRAHDGRISTLERKRN